MAASAFVSIYTESSTAHVKTQSLTPNRFLFFSIFLDKSYILIFYSYMKLNPTIQGQNVCEVYRRVKPVVQVSIYSNILAIILCKSH